MSDLIDLVLVGDPADGQEQFDNAHGVTAQGVEMGLAATLAAQVNGHLSYAFQESEDGDGSELTNTPRHMVKLRLSRNGELVRLGAGLVHESGRRTIQDTRTDGYTRVDLNLSTAPLFRGVAFTGSVRNALNASYSTPGGFEHVQAAIQQSARRVTFGFRISG